MGLMNRIDRLEARRPPQGPPHDRYLLRAVLAHLAVPEKRTLAAMLKDGRQVPETEEERAVVDHFNLAREQEIALWESRSA